MRRFGGVTGVRCCSSAPVRLAVAVRLRAGSGLGLGLAGLAAAGYRLQYQKLISRPALLASMVLVAAAFSLRFFRFGGVQKMVLSGVVAGFMLYVLSKITEDLSKAELLHPAAAAWLPVLIGVLIGLVPLLYLEDG